MRVATAFCIVLGALPSLSGNSVAIAQSESQPAWTITPRQTSTYVADPEAARLLNDVAEFAASLLVWRDSDSTATVRVATLVSKGALGAFVSEYHSGSPGMLGADFVRDRVSAAYRELESPRLIRIAIDQEIQVGLIRPLDLADGPTRIPCILTNHRKSPVRITLDEPGESGARRETHLAPGESRGVYWTMREDPGDTPLTLRITANAHSREITIPRRVWTMHERELLVLDEQGQPTAARLYVTGADRRARTPNGVMTRAVTGEYGQPHAGDVYFYSAGRSKLLLPAGVAEIEVVKGFEHQTLKLQVEITPGGDSRIELRLRRIADLAAEGWHSGDNHIHGNLFAEDRIQPEDVMLIAAAEDLHVVNVLPTIDPGTETISDGRHFEGRPHALSNSDRVLYYNQEYRNNLYHHMSFLGLNSLVEPGYSGWPRTRHPYDDEPNIHPARRAREQGAMVVYVHPNLPSEFPVDLALGVAEAMDVLSQNDEETNTAAWYRLLNCGLRVPISAGTDCFLNVPCHLVAGAGRVYVHSTPRLDYTAWLEGLRSGRSFATNGPLLRLAVNGRGPGAELTGNGSTMGVKVVADANSIVPMRSLELVYNGEVLAASSSDNGVLRLRLEHSAELTESGWLAIRVRGPGHRLAPNDREVYAHTSPVYVALAGRPAGKRDAALYIVSQIEALIENTVRRGHFKSLEERAAAVALFRRGQEVYRRIADQAAP